MFADSPKSLMSDEMLKAYIGNYIRSQGSGEVIFVWQGGEPTLAGIDFYRRAVGYQKEFNTGQTIRNSLQTNGTLLDDEWCRFLSENNFLVGLSLDGPQEIHDRHRRGRQGEASFPDVMRGLELLRKHNVKFNVLAAVTRETANHPLDVYRFFKEENIRYIQFTPIVERLPDDTSVQAGQELAGPALLSDEELNRTVTPWTVDPEKYGDFLNTIFDEWVRSDVGTMFVMNFEWAMSAAIDRTSPICIFSRRCGGAVAVDQNGDVFSCDHYVYPEYRLGNVATESLSDMVKASLESGFGSHKEKALPRWCRECDVVQACWGGCPKHRFLNSPYGEPGLQYLCAGYRKFFSHISKFMTAFIQLEEYGLPPETIMQAVNQPLIIPASDKTENEEVVMIIK